MPVPGARGGRAGFTIFNYLASHMQKTNIFRTVLGVAVDTCGEDTEKIRDFFLKRIDLIPVSWHASYDAAKQHNDTAKVQIEEIKLAVVQEIKAEFTKIWEEHS